MEFTVSEAWKNMYPGAAVGILAMAGVANPQQIPALDKRKAELENELREQYQDFDRPTMRSLPTLDAYSNYYRRFKKTYHVQLQLESVVFKEKSIPQVAALVEAMFMAELKNLILTAGHDLAKLRMPVGIHVANGSERFIRLDNQEQQLKEGDMFIADAEGILSSVIYGPDRRTQITANTRHALFTAYAPPGIAISTVISHLHDIKANVNLIAPDAQVEMLQVFSAK